MANSNLPNISPYAGPSAPLKPSSSSAPATYAQTPGQQELLHFLSTAPSLWKSPNDPPVRKYRMTNGDEISCVFWKNRFFITGTDIVKVLMYHFSQMGRNVLNPKKFEEGVFSDLRNLKPGVDAVLEEPRSEFLEFLHKHGCIRTQKKQKVFYWNRVPHEDLLREALERSLRRVSSVYQFSQMMNSPEMMSKCMGMMAGNPSMGMMVPGVQIPGMMYSMGPTIHPGLINPATQQQMLLQQQLMMNNSTMHPRRTLSMSSADFGTQRTMYTIDSNNNNNNTIQPNEVMPMSPVLGGACGFTPDGNSVLSSPMFSPATTNPTSLADIEYDDSYFDLTPSLIDNTPLNTIDPTLIQGGGGGESDHNNSNSSKLSIVTPPLNQNENITNDLPSAVLTDQPLNGLIGNDMYMGMNDSYWLGGSGGDKMLLEETSLYDDLSMMIPNIAPNNRRY